MACFSIPFFLVGSAGLLGLSFLTERIEVIEVGVIVFIIAFGLYLRSKKTKHGNTCPIDCKCGNGGSKLC